MRRANEGGVTDVLVAEELGINARQLRRRHDARLADIDVEMLLDGTLVSEGHTGDDRCDGIWSLAWLINDVGSRGYGLETGQVFSSGAVAKVVPLDHAREVVVRFNGVEARLNLTD